jgi:predicted nucleic acid-binding protein
MYLVDTNVLSEARRGRSQAREWLRSVDPDHIFISVVTLGEIMKGISLKTRDDATAAAALHHWLEQLRSDYARRILPISDDVALEWGKIAATRPYDMADALIAATAVVHRKTVVTRNASDFKDLDVRVIDPWSLGKSRAKGPISGGALAPRRDTAVSPAETWLPPTVRRAAGRQASGSSGGALLS